MILMLLLLMIVGVGDIYAQSASVWDGSVASGFAGGSGTEANPYIIRTAAQFAYFGSQLNGKSWYVRLDADIDLNNREWTYGQGSRTFKGHFDGSGHTISNVKITTDGSQASVGLIPAMQGTSVSNKAELKNLTVENISVSATATLSATIYYLGGAVGNVNGFGDFENVHVRNVSISIGSATQIISLGGFAARVYKSCGIKSCSLQNSTISVSGSLTGTTIYIGGAVGDCLGETGSPAQPSIIDGFSIENTSVTVGKITATNYVGGCFGRIYKPFDAQNITVNNTSLTYNPTDDQNIIFNVGSFAGATYIDVNDAYGNDVYGNTVHDVRITGAAQLNIGTGSVNLTKLRAGLIGYCGPYERLENWTVERSKVVVRGNCTGENNNIGGFVGYMESTKGSTTSISGPSVISAVSIQNADVSVEGNMSSQTFVGGAVGAMRPSNSVLCLVEKCDVGGKVYTVGNHTFATNQIYAFGGVVGFMTQYSPCLPQVRQCSSTIDIDISSMTPASKSGDNYNLYRMRVGAGGVIGMISNVKTVPEHLYYSGKIYAPFAAVGPIMGVFQMNYSAVYYPASDYAGALNQGNLASDREWLKTDTWYYGDYKLGLSDAVLNQTARTRNYVGAPIAEDGVQYLTITGNTFMEQNLYNQSNMLSSTVLAYNAVGENRDLAIYPNWSTNSATYPAYYMYYMQGVNRGHWVHPESAVFAQVLARKGIRFSERITMSEDATSVVFTADLEELENNTQGINVTFRWYAADGTTPLAGGNERSIRLTRDQLEAAGGEVYCEVTISGDDFATCSAMLHGAYTDTTIVYLDPSNRYGGDDNNDGTKAAPVKTWKRAYSLLNPQGTVYTNYIVLMSVYDKAIQTTDPGLDHLVVSGTYVQWKALVEESRRNVAATITSYLHDNDGNPVPGELDYSVAAAAWYKINANYRDAIYADTRFEWMTFNGAQQSYYVMHAGYYNIEFGHGLQMKNFAADPSYGSLYRGSNACSLQVFGGYTDDGRFKEDPRMFEQYLPHGKEGFKMIFRSGFFSTVCVAGRQTSASTNGIYGSPRMPIKCQIIVDIDREWNLAHNKCINASTATNYDISAILAGNHEGSVYGDVDIMVFRGNTGRLVNGTLGARRVINVPANAGGGRYPYNSFMGRGNILLDPSKTVDAYGAIVDRTTPYDNESLYATEVYGGGLGRSHSIEGALNLPFYGTNTVIINGGTIGIVPAERALNHANLSTVIPAVFAGASGGVNGIGDDFSRAERIAGDVADERLPYWYDNEGRVGYCDYATWNAQPASKHVTVRCYDGVVGEEDHYTDVDLRYANSSIIINDGQFGTAAYPIVGIFGGGSGYINSFFYNSTTSKSYPFADVGTLFGKQGEVASSVTINGGTFHCNIYGAGRGTTEYFSKQMGAGDAYNTRYTAMAKVYGDVEVNINGGTINGDVYGGGAGVATARQYSTGTTNEMLDMARLVGNTTITVTGTSVINGNIYGGGQMGAVDGNTSVNILGGTIEGDVFGAGQGEEGHPVKAKVTGTTNVKIGEELVIP